MKSKITKKCKSKFGLELGTYVGYSTLLALRAMGPEGKMICIDTCERTNKLAKLYTII